MDIGHFITTQAQKKAKKIELDKVTENLITFSNALQNSFLDDAQDMIRDEKQSFKRTSFDEAILFLFLTIFNHEETPFDTIMKIIEENFENHPEIGMLKGEGFNFRTLTRSSSDERSEFDKFSLLKASYLSCSFIINLIVESSDITNICITEIILKSIVENNMFEAIGRILEAKVLVSQGIIKQRKKYRNTYDPNNLEFDYIEKQDPNKTFYFSENQNLALLNANYVKSNFNDDTPTKLKIKEIDIVREMVVQNKKANEIIGIISRATDKDSRDSFFICFALHRKFMLINYLCTKAKHWELDYPLFIMCLENDCHDIAVLLYKDFEDHFTKSEVRKNIVPHILNSFSKGTHLIDAK